MLVYSVINFGTIRGNRDVVRPHAPVGVNPIFGLGKLKARFKRLVVIVVVVDVVAELLAGILTRDFVGVKRAERFNERSLNRIGADVRSVLLHHIYG